MVVDYYKVRGAAVNPCFSSLSRSRRDDSNGFQASAACRGFLSLNACSKALPDCYKRRTRAFAASRRREALPSYCQAPALVLSRLVFLQHFRNRGFGQLQPSAQPRDISSQLGVRLSPNDGTDVGAKL